MLLVVGFGSVRPLDLQVERHTPSPPPVFQPPSRVRVCDTLSTMKRQWWLSRKLFFMPNSPSASKSLSSHTTGQRSTAH